MTSKEAKQRVLAVHPQARVEESPEWSEQRYVCVFIDGSSAGCMGHATTEEEAWITAASRLPASEEKEPATKETVDPATKLLADVMHLWVDGYISKAPESAAEDAISSGKFNEVEQFLATKGISVDYCGWSVEPAKVESGDGLPPLEPNDDDWERAKDNVPSYARDAYMQLACRERQLQASLLRERELRELLRKIYESPVTYRKGRLLKEIPSDQWNEIKAAVTGE